MEQDNILKHIWLAVMSFSKRFGITYHKVGSTNMSCLHQGVSGDSFYCDNALRQEENELIICWVRLSRLVPPRGGELCQNLCSKCFHIKSSLRRKSWISICVFMNNVWGVWSICRKYCRGGDIDRWYWHWWHHCRGRDDLWLWTSGVVASDILNLCIEARRGAFGPFSPSFDINKHLLDCLLNNLPENVHKIVSL